MTVFFILSVLLSFLVTVLISKKLIPFLAGKKLNQPIYEIGPRWHKSKAGTPTMGGLAFIGAIVLTILVLSFFAFEKEELLPLWITLGMAVLFAVIGIIDDRAKLLKKQNEGLKAYQKFLLQLVAASLYLGGMTAVGALETTLSIPFFGVEWEMGFWYYIFALFLIVGINNSVNLTDGIDGLAASTTAVIAAFFSVCAFSALYLNFGHTENANAIGLLSGALFGGCLGFLVYNWNPARVFMGDTGSLFLGGLLSGISFLMKEPLILIVVGLWFVMETVSVIMQVTSYKLTKKRIFKMAPIHHHFEKCGMSEVKIVLFAITSTALLCILSYFFM